MVTVKCIVFDIFIFSLVSFGLTLTKVWKYDYDIHNPKNWIGGKAQDECDGLALDAVNYVDAVVDRLDVKGMALPKSGNLHLLDGAVINFDKDSEDIMNCVRVDRPKIHYWMDPASWIIEGYEDNVAVPHVERVPCQYDDVVFPKGWKSGYVGLSSISHMRVKSFKFGNDTITSPDIGYYETYEFNRGPVTIFDEDALFFVSAKFCHEPSACVCEPFLGNSEACGFVNNNANPECSDAIKPIGFCTEMCGASIQFKARYHFHMDSMRESLKRFTSDTFISMVSNRTNVHDIIIQIVFAEKEFRGVSLQEAKQLFSELSADASLGAENIRIYLSSPYVAGSIAKHAISIVFGTLCGVAAVFGILFFIYSPRATSVHLRNRLRFTSRPLSSFKPDFFAKFKNSENAELILGDAQSLAGSVLSLDKSFDNPLYGKPQSSPSTASTSYDTVACTDMKVTKSEISVENPLYDLNNMEQQVQDVAEEGELIDLKTK